jgi:WhiB family redox-sensing transcriptional regulator
MSGTSAVIVVAHAPNNVEPLVYEPWMDDALCAQVDTEIFFPEKGGSTREGKKICALCSVRDECLMFAVDRQERFGIWGGLSERERRRLSRRPARRGVG